MKNSLLYLLFVISLFHTDIYAQSDCLTAVNVCDKETLIVLQESTAGSIQETLGEVCEFGFFQIDTETNAYWLRYEFESEGDFTFTIIPGSPSDDIDFFVFQSDNNDCTNLNSVRCMLTGENVGGYTDPACFGPTGLATGSTDTEEGLGCQDGDDNFLAPLEVASGEVYYLLINNFNSTGMDDFTIEHGGSATLTCDNSSTTSTNSRLANSISVTPNPFLDMISIKSTKSFAESDNLQIVDLYGRVVSSKRNIVDGEVDLSHLSSGVYFIQITNNQGEVGVHKIVKQ